MRITLYTLVIVLFIISRFTTHPLLSLTIGMMAFAALMMAAYYAKGLYRISGTVFFIIGVGLFFRSGDSFYSFFLHFETMLGILGLFLLLPFLNSLIRVGRYDTKLRMFIEQGVTSTGTLYRRSFFVCHLLGLFLNIGTLPLLKRSLSKSLSSLPRKVADKFYSQNLLRAYALCLTWSPMEVMVVTSLDVTGKSYFQLFPIVISILLIAVSIDWIRATYQYRAVPLQYESDTILSQKELYRNIREMLVLLFMFIVLVSLFNYIFNKGYLLSIVILILPVTIGWAFIIKKRRRFFRLSFPHWQERTKGLSNYYFMFISAGFFVEMLSKSGYLSFLQEIFITHSARTLLLYVIIASFFLLTSLIGFHPLVSLTLLIEMLNPVILNISTISLAVVLITCSLSTVLYSPYNLSVSILADSLKINPYRLGMWNLPFALLYIAIGVFVAYALTFFH
ncbi:hypothetical protein [Halalkalibacter urbisdiaboli]|uniref:hypothetical protein n=1 Tax=Halalkalibacter urbisdiaboli TaxID=1960589 RepID=UPI000B43F61E|nr:hypothetical protein [Halalkalibacter urbisdiaboli]